MTLRRAAAALLALFRQRRLDRELESEIFAHLELAEKEGMASGLSAEQARHAARRRFGGVERLKEEHRDQRSIRWLETLVRDFRYGVASLVRDPGFSAIAASVLALGIGANAAMFSLVDAVLLKPIPFPDPDRIVRLWQAPRPGVTNSTSTPDFLDWKRLGTAFDALTAEQAITMTRTGSGEPVRLPGKAVTADYFKVFNVNLRLGRTFRPDEDQQGASPTVVLSHAAWQTYFGGDPEILRRRPIFDGEPHQVIGVLAPGVLDRDRARFWKALVFTPDQHIRGNHWLTVHGRLRKGITVAQAQAQMDAIDEALAEVTPVLKRKWTIVVESLNRLLVGDNLRRSMIIASGAVALVMLIACLNVANLLLARGAVRRKEMAMRAALGAGRGRLVAQLLTESLVLCLLGGAGGVALASLLIHAASPVLAQAFPYAAEVRLDLRVFAFAALASMAAALLAGTAPSLQTGFRNLSQSLNQSARGFAGSHNRIRRVIVTGEVALSLVLVCGAILLFRSLFKLQQLETGIVMENVLTIPINLPVHTYESPEKAALFYESAAQRLRSVPGVEQAAFSTHLPLLWISNGEGVEIPGVEEPVNVRFKRIDPGYLKAFRIPLLAGRGITDRDRAGSPRVMMINEALAARLAEVGGMKNPVGQRVRLYFPNYARRGADILEVEIAGVIRSERVSPPGRPDPSVVYVPLAQVPDPGIQLIVRTQADPASVVPAIREALRQVDPNLPLGEVATMQEVRERTLLGASRPAWVIGAFAAMAAFLAALGLYGVLAHSLTQQRREIGIRLALGAQSGDILSHVLRNALSMIVAGLGLGLAGAFALTRVMENLLFGVSPLDPVALSAACASMTLIGLLAGWLPASRAARVDPVTTLRED